MNIRVMTPADYDGVYSLWQNTPGMGLNNIDDTREGIEKYLYRNPTTCFVAEKDGSIVGYYSLHVQGDECELNNLCVLPGYRHAKIGEVMLLHALAEAKRCGCARMNLGIVEENIRLRDWYTRYGFNHTGTKKFDFFPFTCGYMTREITED